jgi:hypothetical protein
MKHLLGLLLLLPLAAFAASPEDDYIAARDKFIAQFKLREGEQVTDAIAKAEVAARADLEKKMQALIGASGIRACRSRASSISSRSSWATWASACSKASSTA